MARFVARSPKEPRLKWLNRSPGAGPILAAIEDWLDSYPRTDRQGMLSRLWSPDDLKHYSAAFELFLHALFVKFRYTVDVHPEVPGSTKHPDFLVSGPEDVRFFVEACVVRGRTEAEMEREKNVLDLTSLINEIDSPTFHVFVDSITSPGGTLPRKKVSRHVQRMIADGLPEPYTQGGWEILFRLERKPRELRLSTFGGGRVMGRSFDDVEPIRKAITGKAYDHNPDAPYVIAVHALAPWVSQGPGRDTFWEALLGDEVFTIPVSPQGPLGEGGFRRLPTGALTRAKGSRYRGEPRYTRVSGLLATAASSYPGDIRYYPNPWAAYPLGAPFPLMSRYERQGDDMVLIERDTASSVLGLPRGWPNGF